MGKAESCCDVTVSMYLGIDIGATTLAAGVTRDAEAPPTTARRDTPREAGELTDAVVDLVHEACTDAGIRPESIRAAGIGSVGPLDTDAGRILDSPNLPAGGIPIVDTIGRACGVQDVRLLNDTTAGVLGERAAGTDPPETTTVYLTLSTGISAGISVGGTVLGGNVGEVGHWIVDPDTRRRCGCGGAGHWEAYCGGRNIPSYARYLHENHAVQTTLPLGADKLRAADIFDRYEEDELATLTVNRIKDWNEIGIRNIAHAFAPSTIVIGGGVALENEPHLIEGVGDRLADGLVVESPAIRPPAWGPDSVLRGAVLAAAEW